MGFSRQEYWSGVPLPSPKTQTSYYQTSICCCSVDQPCPTFCNPMNCSTPGFPVHYQLLELAQTHVHRVSDAIQPSYPLLSPSPPAFNLSSIRVLFNESALHIRWPNSLLSLDYLDLKLDIGYGEGNGNPLQYSYLENPMDGGAWWAVVHGVAKSQTRLSDFPFTFHFHALEKEMATHSSVLAWRIPGMGEPGGLPSMGSHRVRHD